MAESAGEATTLHEASGAIAQTIGAEVLEKTGGDLYRSGQPLRGTPESAEPTSAEIASQTPQTKPETPTVEEPKKYGPGGKYTSIEEWEKGTVEAGNTISQLRQQNDALAARLNTIEQTIAPQKIETPKDPLDEIENFGIPKEPVKAAIRETFKQLMNEAGNAYAVRAKADQEVIGKYPEYQEKYNDLQAWLAQHPEEYAAVDEAEKQGQFKLAREYAWLKYREANGTREETEKIEESKAQEKEKAQRRVDASVSDRSSGHTRDQSTAPKDPNKVSAEDLDRVQKLSKAGYERKAWAELLGPLLPNEQYFGQ